MATALNPQFAAEIVRQRLGLKNSSANGRIILMIPEALKRTARKGAQRDDLRDMFLSVRASTTGAISSGRVNLTTLEDTYRILREYLDMGQIWHSSSAYPLQKVAPLTGVGMSAYLGTNTNFVFYYVEGQFIILPGGETGSLEFAVPTFPGTVAQLPNSKEVETIFLDTLVEMAQGELADIGADDTAAA